MNIQGTVKQVLEPISGTSQKGDWKKQTVIIETEGQYPKEVAIDMWNALVGTLKVGENINAHIDISSREYNDRWYTEIRCYKFDLTTSAF